MKLTSTDFQNEGQIPVDCTCDGKDRSPELQWSDFPKATKSFAVLCNDPDAPGGRWVHWLVVNIPPDINALGSGAVIDDHGLEIENSFGRTNYGGPCPPSGEHRYVFTVYALDVSAINNVNRADFEKQIAGNILDSATLTGLYSRPVKWAGNSSATIARRLTTCSMS